MTMTVFFLKYVFGIGKRNSLFCRIAVLIHKVIFARSQNLDKL